MFASILCATDASAGGRAARRHALLLAEAADAVEWWRSERAARHDCRPLLDRQDDADLLVAPAGRGARLLIERASVAVLLARRCPLGTELTDRILVVAHGDDVALGEAASVAGRLAARDAGAVAIVAGGAADRAAERPPATCRRILTDAIGRTPPVVGPVGLRGAPAVAAAVRASLLVVARSPATDPRYDLALAGAVACSVLVVPGRPSAIVTAAHGGLADPAVAGRTRPIGAAAAP